jgi:hypothetical protein
MAVLEKRGGIKVVDVAPGYVYGHMNVCRFI